MTRFSDLRTKIIASFSLVGILTLIVGYQGVRAGAQIRDPALAYIADARGFRIGLQSRGPWIRPEPAGGKTRLRLRPKPASAREPGEPGRSMTAAAARASKGPSTWRGVRLERL